MAKRTPLIADLKPGGRFLAKDLHATGGVYAVLKALLERGALHGECLTLAGDTLEATLRKHAGADGEVVKHEPIMASGGIVVLKGNLASDGALIKVAGLKSLEFQGRARVFDSEEACADVVKRRAYKAGEVLVIRDAATHPLLEIGKATSSSSATKGRAAVPGCARCWASPP